MRHTWKDGLKRIPFHLFTWGIFFSIASIWFGWLAVAFAFGASIRGEIYDVFESKTDTPAKAWIDFLSETTLPIIVMLIRIRM